MLKMLMLKSCIRRCCPPPHHFFYQSYSHPLSRWLCQSSWALFAVKSQELSLNLRDRNPRLGQDWFLLDA